MRVPTVKVIGSDDGPLIINVADFDPEIHELWKAGEKVEAPDTPDALATHKGGGRWIVEIDGKLQHKGTLTKTEAKAMVDGMSGG